MPGLAVADIPDLVNTTLPHFKDRGKFKAAYKYQQYHFIDEVFGRDKETVQDGTHVDFTVIFDGNGLARHTRLYATRTYNVVDVVRRGNAPWCFADGAAIYEAHELGMARGAAAITKFIKTRYFAAYVDIANEIEAKAVAAPESAADDTNPRGLAFGISMLAAGAVDPIGGFNGILSRYADGTSTTTAYGINAAIETLWRNWAATKDGMSLVTCEAMRRALIYTKFIAPRSVKEMVTGPASKRRILWSLSYQAEYERLVNSGSDGRNGDLSPFKDQVTFRGVRTVGLPTLENAAYAPIYGVDFACWYPIVHSKFWLTEDDPIRDVDQRHVWIQGIDCQYQYICTNRRNQFVLHDPIPA